MDDKLLDYFLNLLDDEANQEVEAYVRAHPEAQERLRRLDRALEPLARERDSLDPPAGLVLRTIARVAEHRCPSSSAPAVIPAMLRSDPRPVSWFRRVDVLVAACLLITLGLFLFPWLAGSRADANRLACQNNLKDFWQALQIYSQTHQGQFPRVEENGARSFAGMVVPLLADAGVLPENISVGCPAVGRQPPPRITLGEIDSLWEKPGKQEYNSRARQLFGSYAYSLGYRLEEKGPLKGLDCEMGENQPIMADYRPYDARTPNSPNHDGSGQNVLFVGGNIRWCPDPFAGRPNDNIYLNRHQQVLAGIGPGDTVLGPSDASPGSVD